MGERDLHFDEAGDFDRSFSRVPLSVEIAGIKDVANVSSGE